VEILLIISKLLKVINYYLSNLDILEPEWNKESSQTNLFYKNFSSLNNINKNWSSLALFKQDKQASNDYQEKLKSKGFFEYNKNCSNIFPAFRCSSLNLREASNLSIRTN